MEKLNKNLLILLFLSFAFLLSKETQAVTASLWISPKSQSHSLEEEFDISLGITPNEGSVDALQGDLILENLSCKSLSLAEGISAVTMPSCSNLKFVLGIQGGTASQKTLFKLRVKGVGEGTAKVTPKVTEVYSMGNLVNFTQEGALYTITPSCTCTEWEPWQKGECNQGGCVDQRVEVRTRDCSPRGCDIESQTRCLEDPVCKPKPEPKIVIQPPYGLSGVFLEQKNSILISWKPSPTKEISGYFILKKLSPETYYKLMASVTQGTLTYEDKNINLGNIYDYTIVAFQGRSWETSNKSGFPPKVTVMAQKKEEKKIEGVEEEGKKEESLEDQSKKQIEIALGELGILKETFSWQFPERNFQVEIPEGTQVFQNGNALEDKPISLSIKFLEDQEINEILKTDKSLEKRFIKNTGYFIEGVGISFDRPIKIKIGFKEEDIPQGGRKANIEGKVFDGKEWRNLETERDMEKNIAILKTTHFSIFALFLKERKPMAPLNIQSEKIDIPWTYLVLSIISTIGLVSYWFWQEKKKKSQMKKKDKSQVQRETRPDVIDLRKIKKRD